MNPYFWCFAVYALWITPVTLHMGIQYDQKWRWAVKLKLAGVTVMNRTSQNHQPKAKASGRKRMSWSLLKSPEFKQMRNILRFDSVNVYARLAFEDAALTAMSFALVQTVLDTLVRCGALKRNVRGRIEADFRAGRPVLEIQGIVSAYLGNLAIAYARFAFAQLRAHIRQMREEKYAASH